DGLAGRAATGRVRQHAHAEAGHEFPEALATLVARTFAPHRYSHDIDASRLDGTLEDLRRGVLGGAKEETRVEAYAIDFQAVTSGGTPCGARLRVGHCVRHYPPCLGDTISMVSPPESSTVSRLRRGMKSPLRAVATRASP